MAVNGQDFGLIVGVEGGGSISGRSGRLIQEQLNTIFKNLNTSQFRIQLPRNAIDATTAVKQMQKQIEASLKAITINPVIVKSVPTATAQATTGKSTGSGGVIDASLTAELNKQIALLRTLEKSAAQAYTAFNKVGTDRLATADINALNTKYATWQQQVENLRSSQRALSEEQFAALQREGQEVINLTNRYKEQQVVATKAASAPTSSPEFSAQIAQLKAYEAAALQAQKAIPKNIDLSAYGEDIAQIASKVDNLRTALSQLESTQTVQPEATLRAYADQAIEVQRLVEDLNNKVAEAKRVAADTIPDGNEPFGGDLQAELKQFQQSLDQYTKARDTLNNNAFLEGKDAALSEINAQLDNYKAALAAVQAQEKSGSAVAQNSINQLAELSQELEQVISKRKHDAATAERTAKKERASLREVLALYKQLDTYLKRNPRALDTAQGQELAKMRDSLYGVVQASQSAAGGLSTLERTEFTNLRTQIAGAQSALRGMGQEGRSLSNVIMDAYQKFGGWTLITRSMTGMIHQLRNMVDVVKEIDSAMTELQKVTDETDLTYANFLDNAAERAQNLGATVADTVSATADFARLGYDIDLSSEMADAALVYKNVGDGIEDIGTASESIISTMQAFNEETLTAMSIVDRFNEVDNKFAITALGVGEALTRSASAMAAANNTLDESIALITAANTVVQNPEHVGTTLKTVSMYLRAAKTELEDAGESTEGMATSVSELRESLLALTGGKVDIQIDEDTFKSTYQIMDELSQIWDTLTDISQANILEMIGGKRNSNVVAAVLENFDIARQALDVSANSAGSALRENEKQLESIAGHITRLQVAFEELSVALIDSSTFKTAIDALTTVLNLLTEIVDTVGALPAIVTTITGLLSATRSIRNKPTGLFEIFGSPEEGAKGLRALLTKTISAADIRDASSLGIPKLVSQFNALSEATKNSRQQQQDYINSIKASTPVFADYAKTLFDAKKNASLLDYLNFAKDPEMFEAVEVFNSFRADANYKNTIGETTETFEQFTNRIKDSRPEIADYFSTLDKGNASFDGCRKYCASASNSIDAMGKSAKAASVSMALLDTAVNMLLGLAISAAMQGVISLIDNAINAAVDAADKAREAADESLESFEAIKEETESLESLIKNYEELAAKGSFDSGFRRDAKEIQEQIVSLVGSEAEGLDLVNGHLSTQLQTLKAISDEQRAAAERSAVTAYNNEVAANQIAQGTESYLYNKGLEYAGESDIDAQRIFRAAGLDFEGRGHKNETLLIDVQGTAGEQIKQLEQYLEALRSDLDYDWENSALYSGLETSLERLKSGLQQQHTLAVEAARLISDTSVLTSEALDIDSLDDLMAERERIFNELKQNSTIQNMFELGDITESELLSVIDDSLFEVYPRFVEQLQEVTARENQINALVEHMDKGSLSAEELKERLSSLSDEDLSTAYNIIITDEGIANWEQLIAEISRYNAELETTESVADRVKASVEDIWYSDDFADARAELEGLVRAGEDIRPDRILDLAESSDALKSVLSETGITAEYLAHIFETMGEEGGGLDLITPEYLELNSALEGLAGRFDEITAAKSRFDEAMAVEEKDEGFRSYASALETLKGEFEAGTVNSNAFWAAAEYLFGEDQLSSWGWDAGVEQIYAAMQDVVSIFGDADSAASGFLDALYGISENGQILDDDGTLLGTIERLSDGSYSFDIDDSAISNIADELKITEEAALSCLKALDMWGTVNFYDTEELLTAIADAGLSFGSVEDGLIINSSGLEKALRSLGKNGAEIHSIFETLSAIDGITFLDFSSEVSDLILQLQNLGLAMSSSDGIMVDYSGLADLLLQLSFTREEAEGVFKQLGAIDGIRFTNAQGEVKDLNEVLDDVGRMDFQMTEENASDAVGDVIQSTEELDTTSLDNVTGEFDALTSSANESCNTITRLINYIKALNRQKVSIKFGIESSGRVPSSLYGSGRPSTGQNVMMPYASGTDDAKAGKAVTGENGEELVVSGDEAYFVGANGPEIVTLQKGDTVYNAEQTKRIKRGMRGYRGIMPARSSGQNNSSSPTISFGGAASGTISAGKPYSPTVSVSVEPEVDESALEELKEQIQDYLNEQQNAITLVENVFALDIENDDIPRLEGHANEIILHYKQMQEAVLEQAQRYKDMGLDLTSDEVAEMLSLWKQYEDGIKDIKQQVVDHLRQMVSDASAAVDDIQNAYDVLKSAAEEYAETSGYISVDAFQQIVELGPQYMQYLEDENGLLIINEERINRVIAAKTEQLALENAMTYVEQLRLALQEQDLLRLNELLYATSAASDATWGLVYASLALLNLNGDQYAAALHNINSLRALADNAISGIGQVSSETISEMNDQLREELEGMRDGVSDILQYVMDMMEDRVENQIDQLEEMKDKYADIIELKKESLEVTREENEYSDEVADKVKELAELQSRIDTLALDDSRDAQAQRNQLIEDMQELQEELAEQQADHAYDKQVDSLDDMQEAYEQEKDQEIAILEESISSTQKIYEMAINYIRSNWSTLYEELLQWNYQQGSVLNSEITEAWNQALAAAQRYGQYISNDLIAAIESEIESINNISNSVTGGGSITVGQVGDYDNSYTSPDMVRAIVAQMKSLSAEWSEADGDSANNQRLHEQAAALAARLPQYGVRARYEPGSGMWYIDDDELNPSNNGKPLYSVYHKGGIVGDVGSIKENETLGLLQNGEAVISNENKTALYRMIDFVSKLSKRLDTLAPVPALSPLLEAAGSIQDRPYSNITTNNSPNIHFGDVKIYGQGDAALEKYRAVTREFTNDVLKHLKIKR